MALQKLRRVSRVKAFNLLRKISVSLNSSYPSPLRRVFAANSSAYYDGLIPACCANREIAESDSVTISLFVYFTSRKFTTYE